MAWPPSSGIPARDELARVLPGVRGAREPRLPAALAGGLPHPPCAAHRGRASIFAARMKSLSVSPSILCVQTVTPTLPQAR
jgi:hypothetical protein